MRKNLKELNRITLTLFFIGLIIFVISEGVSRLAIAYVLIMTIYFLAAELFDFHLWEVSSCKRNQLQYLINEMEEQENEQTGHDQVSD
ncbi:hypothetical protein IW492_02940 [Enterococcus sp. BWB1-3]|uniref:hypothetical protein n=1 Tax=Enterococcus sp. BWB1-3 TaxID=2787713 RepID=UPI001922E1FD|nr:hypothetical protein [Enterococcus sp. BWB1-3]MBL1228188.1 hypothetical protein [Enterococcus sp. BWB1-3]